MSKRISTGRIELKNKEPANGLPFKEDWMGEAELNGEMVSLLTDIEALELGHSYSVVYERINLLGEDKVVIHEIVDGGMSPDPGNELPSD